MSNSIIPSHSIGRFSHHLFRPFLFFIPFFAVPLPQNASPPVPRTCGKEEDRKKDFPPKDQVSSNSPGQTEINDAKCSRRYHREKEREKKNRKSMLVPARKMQNAKCKTQSCVSNCPHRSPWSVLRDATWACMPPRRGGESPRSPESWAVIAQYPWHRRCSRRVC